MTLRAVALLTSSTFAIAQTGPTFSGVWEMNVSKSTPAAPRPRSGHGRAEPTVLNVTERSFTGDEEEKYSFKYAFGSERVR